MKLKILNSSESLKFKPKVKTYVIRIFSGLVPTPITPLDKNNNLIKVNEYFFDDVWPRDFKEYSWYDTSGEEFQKYLKNEQKKYPKMTKESLMGYFEARGHPEGRDILFSSGLARKLYAGFEEHKKDIEQVVISSSDAKHRPSAVGIAMNEIYGWSIKGLKEKFPSYRRFVYDIMKEVGEEFR